MKYTNVNEQLQTEYRNKLDEIMVRGMPSDGKHGRKSVEALHIPNDEETKPLCAIPEKTNVGWQMKDIAIYPPAHKNICKRCIAVDNGDLFFKEYSDAELREHLESVWEKSQYKNLSMKEYNRLADDEQPCAGTIKKRFGSWTAAKEQVDP